MNDEDKELLVQLFCSIQYLLIQSNIIHDVNQF